MSDVEPRPRPQYGEYATPEEQRARIQDPEANPLYATPPAPVEAEAGAPAVAAGAASAPATRRVRPVDRIVTFALLAYGLVNVVTSFSAFAQYADYAEMLIATMGADVTLSDPAAGRPWGIAAAIVLAIGWFLTAALSWWNVRRGRLSWWIPIVGGLVFTFAAGVLMTVPIMNDPAVWRALLDTMS